MIFAVLNVAPWAVIDVLDEDRGIGVLLNWKRNFFPKSYELSQQLPDKLGGFHMGLVF